MMTPSTRTINSSQDETVRMATEEGSATESPLDEVMDDIRRELVRRVALADRDANRDIYDTLGDE